MVKVFEVPYALCYTQFMIHRYTHEALTWIDLESPTTEEIRLLMEEFSLDPLIAEELLSSTLRPRIDIRNDYFYLVLHFPALQHSHKSSMDQEVDFIVGKNWMITTRYDTVDPFHTFSKIFEVNSMLDRTVTWNHAGDMFFQMASTLYASVSNELEHLEDRLERAEEDVFDGREKEMVLSLSMIGRDLLNFRQALVPHKTMLDSLYTATEPLFGNSFSQKIHSIIGEYYRLWNNVETHSASLHELRETNNSLLTTKQNETIKTFTILAFSTLPMTVVASIFGMNTENAPFIGRQDDFWIVITLMVTVGLLCLLYFKYKHWL